MDKASGALVKSFSTVPATATSDTENPKKTKMKSTFFLLVLCALIVAITCVPAVPDTDVDESSAPWYNNYSYQYMMCRLRCRQSCLEQGYWKGVCKQGATCYCFGPMGAYGRVNGFPMGGY